MELIDEKGRLFGRVNVVDALVVLLVLAVVAAGVALVTGGPAGPGGDGGGGGETDTRYATLALGPQSAEFAATVRSGRNVTLAGTDATVRVTDVYLTGADDGVRTFLRIAYPAEATVGDAPIRAGRSITVVGEDYQTTAAVRSVGDDRSTFRTGTTPVSITTTLDAETAAAVDAGDAFTVGNRTLATVESVTAMPTDASDSRRLRLGVALVTRTVGDEPQFAGRTLRVGTSIPLRTDAVDGFSGTVTGVGSLDPAGEATTVTMTVAWENVRPAVADALSTGMVESHRGATARVVDVTAGPATVVVPTDSGDLVVREHPRNRDVTLTVEATARRIGSELRFHGRPLSEGRTVTLEFDTVTLRGTVLDFETNG